MQIPNPQFPRITIDPNLCSGKPCIRGMRFQVVSLLSYLASGMSVVQILADFPFLEQEDIFESLAFAAASISDTALPC
ncbi:MAG: DUF433 domain-containing protein [Bacteroidota bacterium]